ncbi:MAG: DUF2207 domain-containing protein, partial [Calditrichaeota bacterium]
MLFTVLMATRPGLAKRYSLERVVVVAQIRPDGSLDVQESRTYRFRGRFSWADYRLDLSKVGVVREFVLREGEEIYRLGENQTPGSYVLRQDDDAFYVKWFYRARNERRTFTLSYTVTDAVWVYQDAAEFYYQFVGRGNPQKIGAAEVRLALPVPADSSRVKIWAHGPLWGEIRFEHGKIAMHVSPLPAQTFWEARVLFPSDWVPAVSSRRAGEISERVMAEERELAERANQARRAARARLKVKRANEKLALRLSFVLAGVGFLVWLGLYRRFGQGFSVPYHNKIDSTPPEDLHPTLASYLLFQKQLTGGAMMATLLQLAQRGLLKIEQSDQTRRKRFSWTRPSFSLTVNRSLWQEQKENLLDFENELLSFLFEELSGGGDTLEMRDFRKNRTRLMRWFRGWKKLVQRHVAQPYWDKESVKGTAVAAAVSGLIAILGILMVFVLGATGAVAIAGGVVLLGLSFVILRYTPETKLLRLRLRAFQRYLKKYHFRQADRTSLLENIQTYLVFAVALGAGSRALKELLSLVPQDRQDVIFPWFVSHAAYASPAEFAHAVSSLVSVATSTVSSST